MQRTIAVLLFAVAAQAADLSLFGSTIAAGDSGTVAWTWQARQRSARVHVPTGYDGATARPLVVVLHGGGGTAAAIESSSRWNQFADGVGCLVAYPQGLSLDATGIDAPDTELAYWANDRDTRPDTFGIDDVGMIGGLCDAIAAASPLDADRVYAMGMSNGGMMVHRLGRDDARRWAGLCSVSGTLTATPSVAFAPANPISVLIIHGSSDTVVPYAGGTVLGQGGPVIGAEATRDLWLTADGITAPGVASALPDAVDDGCTSTRYDYAGGNAGTAVALIRVDGGNHSWPGGTGSTGAGAGSKTDDFRATDTAWAFFAAHRRQPEADLSRGGAAIACGGSSSGLALPSGVASNPTWTLTNLGAATLTCSGLAITVTTGCTAEVVGAPPAAIAPGASAAITLRITPDAATWSCSASIACDDEDEAEYAWTTTGTTATAGGTSDGTGGGNGSGSGSGGGCGAGTPAGLLILGISLGLAGGRRRAAQPSATGSRPS